MDIAIHFASKTGLSLAQARRHGCVLQDVTFVPPTGVLNPSACSTSNSMAGGERGLPVSPRCDSFVNRTGLMEASLSYSSLTF